MQRLGLALSGGGFRATLYHLGVVRFLRDAEILPKITHITTVSGGSILGAHLALNWDRYCGSPDQFEEAAEEILQVVRMDVRNRIVRRFPFASAASTVLALLRMRPPRQLSRPGLLEKHYERFLYGDVPLSQLPERPRLHILSTNLSEGCLCSFNRTGLLLQRRVRGRRDRFERVQIGLATVPMAVAASSAFPGFFPPLELTGWDVGADEGEFGRQTFTDGGVYDNLGLRMFRCIEQSWIRDAAPLRKDDFLELDAVTISLMSANNLPEDTPLRRLREKLDTYDNDHALRAESGVSDDSANATIRGLWEIIRSDRLYREPCFQNVELTDATAQSLLNYVVESGRDPDLDNRSWLNRQIVESALRQVIGKPCLRMSRRDFDGILVSDAGGKFKVTREVRRGGLISTALRASDILMDRVWQLEMEAFDNTPDVLFFPISDVVDRSRDRTALDPAVQRQAARIRTDLDLFSDLEISSLVQHGYCVARNVCRSQAELLKADIPSEPPWNPVAEEQDDKETSQTHGHTVTDEALGLRTARQLRQSSRRRIGTRLLSLRDWPTYVWIVLVTSLAVSLPYYAYKERQQSQQQRMVLSAVADMSPDYRKILDLLRHGPAPRIEAMPYEEVESLEPPDYTGFEVLSDTRIFDLRPWADPTGTTPAVAHARLSVRRTTESSDNTHLRLQRVTADDKGALFCPTLRFNPTLKRARNADAGYLWELDFDLSRIPLDGRAEIVMQRTLTSETATDIEDEGRFNFSVLAETSILEVWLLLPEGRYCGSFDVSGYPIGSPELARVVVPHSRVQLAFGSIATFRLINPDVNFRYLCRWTWRGESREASDK